MTDDALRVRVPSAGVRTLDARDGIGVAVVVTFFLVMLVLTWHRWADPVIDHGRELNVPARLLSGELLYRDIYWYYGPLAPYLGAALYGVFGVRMDVLHASGMVSAMLILLPVYWLSRQVLDVFHAVVATSLVLAVCVFPPLLGNYVQPYSFAALYGSVFTALSLASSVRHLTARSGRWLLGAGGCGGLALACKPELAAVAVVPGLAAWAVTCFSERRWSWRSLAHLLLPVIVIGGTVYGTFVLIVPWRLLFTQTYEAHIQPEMIHFMAGITGTRFGMDGVWAMLKSLGVCFMACGVSAGCAVMLGFRTAPSRLSKLLALTATALGALLIIATPQVRGPLDIQPFRAAPLVIGATLVWGVWRLVVRDRQAERTTTYREEVTLVLCVFALMTIARTALNVSLVTVYHGFTLPMTVVVYIYLFVNAWPSLFPAPLRGKVAVAGTTMLVLIGLTVSAWDVTTIRSVRNTVVRTERGTFLTDNRRASAFTKAIDYVQSRTAPHEMVVTLPEGTMINFLADRPYPLGDEIVQPGYLTQRKEHEIIQRLEALNVRLIVLNNRLTPEYLRVGFGTGYGHELMAWINAHYRPTVTFDETPDGRADLPFGAKEFFLRAYERR